MSTGAGEGGSGEGDGKHRRPAPPLEVEVLPRRGRGQPTKITRAVIAEVARCRALGMSQEDSCASAGIDPSTQKNWINQGREEYRVGGTTIHVEFFLALRTAAARGKSARREVITRVASGKSLREGEGKTDEDVPRARLMLQFEALLMVGRYGKGGGQRKLPPGVSPLDPGALTAEERPPAVELSRLSEAEFTRYQELAARLRLDFASVPVAELSELQSLVRKARGDT